MVHKLLIALCALGLSTPVWAQYPLQAGPVPYISTPTSNAAEAANFAISSVNKYLSGMYGGVAIVNPTFTGSLSGPSITNTQFQGYGGTWGAGALANGQPPIVQFSSFSGTTSSSTAAFGAFLQQSDNSYTTNVGAGSGFVEQLLLTGPNVQGTRVAMNVKLDVQHATANPQYPQYIGLSSFCDIHANDAPNAPTAPGAICFGINAVADCGSGFTCDAIVGGESNTWSENSSTTYDKIGWQIVDIYSGGSGLVQGSHDDVAFSINNQAEPTSTLGWTYGIEFGRKGGDFPISTGGTLIYGQDFNGGTWTVANGVDWHLGTATSYWQQWGSVASLTGAGVLNTQGYSEAGTAGVTCSGTPTSSFATKGGIVTHC